MYINLFVRRFTLWNVLTSRKIGTVVIVEGGIQNDAESVGTVYVVSVAYCLFLCVVLYPRVFLLPHFHILILSFYLNLL
jgi:hypothetical protein